MIEFKTEGVLEIVAMAGGSLWGEQLGVGGNSYAFGYIGNELPAAFGYGCELHPGISASGQRSQGSSVLIILARHNICLPRIFLFYLAHKSCAIHLHTGCSDETCFDAAYDFTASYNADYYSWWPMPPVCSLLNLNYGAYAINQEYVVNTAMQFRR